MTLMTLALFLILVSPAHGSVAALARAYTESGEPCYSSTPVIPGGTFVAAGVSCTNVHTSSEVFASATFGSLLDNQLHFELTFSADQTAPSLVVALGYAAWTQTVVATGGTGNGVLMMYFRETGNRPDVLPPNTRFFGALPGSPGHDVLFLPFVFGEPFLLNVYIPAEMRCDSTTADCRGSYNFTVQADRIVINAYTDHLTELPDAQLFIVPEPASLGLCALCLGAILGVAAQRGRRRAPVS